jgi:hypothetical protein
MNYIFQNIINNYYYSLIFLALVFYTISNFNPAILLSLMIVIYLYAYIDSNIKANIANNNSIEAVKDKTLKNEVANIKEINTNNFVMNKDNKIINNVKHLVKNKEFVNIIYNIRFIKKFDKTRYTNLIIYMNKLMKVYIYILSDRYDLNVYLPIFNDIRNDILEYFYSLIFVIPDKFKHIYGFDPHSEIDKSLSEFREKVKDMLTILTNYGKIGMKKEYINMEYYRPYEKNQELYLP